MPHRVAHACWKLFRSACTAACMLTALSGSLTHAVLGELVHAKLSAESEETECEALGHDATALRRSQKLVLRVVSTLPAFSLPILAGSGVSALDRATSSTRDGCRLPGGQHALRNGLGAPLVT